MARYTGPKSKIARKFGEPIYGPDKALERRNYPSGQHGLARRRRKISEYGVQLKEKQKAKYTYGLLEKQFRILFEKAERAGGVTGEVLLQMLECRLDNSGTRYVKVFHDKNYESVLEGEIIETGVGIVLRKKMSHLGELFIFRKKKD